MDKLSGTVPVAPVYDLKPALDSPFVREHERILEAAHPTRGKIRTLACPIQFSDEPGRVGTAPALGDDTEDVLGGLGYSTTRIAELRDAGVT
jgi:crotonobetainyl-CoA:carnitine CoA-transferase CaiB-like acyl-CoA transferase